jgi:hypothetical protein
LRDDFNDAAVFLDEHDIVGLGTLIALNNLKVNQLVLL